MFSIWIPIHQFEKPIEGMFLKKIPKKATINQGNVPKKTFHQPSFKAMLPTPIDKPSPVQYYKRPKSISQQPKPKPSTFS
jgi:hypothetical protein